MFTRYVCVKQQDQSDCGAAALATIALHYRQPIAVQKMRELAGTDRVGTNLLGLAQAAEKIGFSAKAVQGPFEELKNVPLPAIAHWATEEGLGHFVVLHRVKKDSVVIADPAREVLTVSREEFSRRWTGFLLLLTPEENLVPREKLKKPSSPWRRFVGLLRPHMSIFVEAFFCAILVTLLGLSTSYFIQHLVDSVLVHGEWRLLNALAVGMLILLVFRSLFGLLRQYLLVHVSRKVDLGLISHYSRHVLGQPVKFFELRQVGEILSRVSDAVKVRQAISGTTLAIVVDATLVVVALGIMLFYDAKLTLAAAAAIPIFVLTVSAHHPATKRLSRTTMEQAAKLQSHLVEDVSAVDTIKSFGAERRRAEEGDSRLVRMIQSVFSLQKIDLSMGTLGTFITAAAGIVVLWYGGHRVIDGVLTIGELMFFYSLLGMMLGPLERLSTVNLEIQDALVAIDRLGEILDLEPEKLEEDHQARFQGVRQEIRFEGVRFKYGCRSEVLKGIDLRIPAGKTVGIVGESGSGKSTLLKLLQRFYDPTEGRITVDGIDLRDVTLSSLRSKIGIVSQEPYVFNGSIRENIALGKPDATLGEIVAAARTAQLNGFIDQLPERYETLLGERGANLSGGQRQRLAIARAILARPEIVIFDEATSHLDSATEEALQASLRDSLVGTTAVLVAHRLSTIRGADLIYVLDQGTIAEQGMHEELLAQDGRYARLWRTQIGVSEEPWILPILDEAPPQNHGKRTGTIRKVAL